MNWRGISEEGVYFVDGDHRKPEQKNLDGCVKSLQESGRNVWKAHKPLARGQTVHHSRFGDQHPR